MLVSFVAVGMSVMMVVIKMGRRIGVSFWAVVVAMVRVRSPAMVALKPSAYRTRRLKRQHRYCH